ncbi:MAG TPA: rRNA maturation RNase YbeY [Gammaproteobacteria bacterium]|nr:rRNA maturation RNase YbeY [Gammaproteobacteria bacterium]
MSENKTVSVEVSIADDIGSAEEDIPEASILQDWINAAWQGEGTAVVSLRIAGNEEIRHLNREYRHKDKATNVLSFPMDIPADIEPKLLGDIALCVPVIKAEAEAQGKTLQAHWAHMLVHGMLHLQGYDHIEDDEARQMETLEIQILEQLGFANPYQDNPPKEKAKQL